MTVEVVDPFVGPEGVLVEGAPDGPLAGVRLAVKDVFDVAGTVTGAGNPDFARGRPPATTHAAAVASLVAAGATVVGKTLTDELAWSLMGTNAHLGTPANPAAPGRITGGSSAGSAAATAAGRCDLGLGTDTGGSIRVPASYCGLVGWRPTHGVVDDAGLVPLAPTFDTVGCFARDAALLATAADVLLLPGLHPTAAAGSVGAAPVEAADDGSRPELPETWGAGGLPLVLAAELLAVVGPGAQASVGSVAQRWGAGPAALGVDLEAAAGAFRVLQAREAWRQHGDWVEAAHPSFGPGVAARFAAAAEITDEEVDVAQRVRDEVRAVVADATAGGRLVVGPAAAGAAPPVDASRPERDAVRAQLLLLTAVAGLAGAPVVVLPLAEDEGLPLGVAVMGAPGTDRALLRWAVDRMAA